MPGSREAVDRRFEAALEHAEGFFLKTGRVHRAMLQLARRLDEAQIPYAIAGAMALSVHGYVRVTTGVDILLTRKGLAQFKALFRGRGYVEKFPGSRGMRDTENDVPVDALMAGEFPGDGQPKPVAFGAGIVGSPPFDWRSGRPERSRGARARVQGGPAGRSPPDSR
jgi:hypothetical protein